ncbi:MAG: hypothetical protein A2X36_11245 [Elusimicrobia bacterium GWA2_69_24]|nr:MAG: hypothetical protein A2X36_11245 [Elusimicrobia bacterium GWA2_69_24]HBL18093.1 hypothetical protein [Elusimicrobiota bacterium]
MSPRALLLALWAAGAASLAASAAPFPAGTQKGFDRFFEGDLEGAVESWQSARAGVPKHVVLDGVILLGLKVLVKEELQSYDFLVSGMRVKQARALAPEDEDLDYLATMAARGGNASRPWSARQLQYLDASAERESLINMVMMLDLRQKGRAEEKKGRPRDYSGFVSRLLDPQIADPPGTRPPRPEPAEPPAPKGRVEKVSLDQALLGPEKELLAAKAAAKAAAQAPEEEEPEAVFPEDDLPPPPRRQGKQPPVPAARTKNDLAYSLRIGRNLFYQGDYKGAMKWFQSALNADIESEAAQSSFNLAATLWREKRADFKYQYALSAYYRGNYPEAERYFRQALQLKPEFEEARRGLLMVAR